MKYLSKVKDLTFDFCKSMFGGAATTVQIADEFETQAEAETFVREVKTACESYQDMYEALQSLNDKMGYVEYYEEWERLITDIIEPAIKKAEGK
jgi:ABC-type phosphate transport system substrate-binding protein